jgi:hypothetical protein
VRKSLKREATIPLRRPREHDGLAEPLRSRFQVCLTHSVDMIDIAIGCAKRTYKFDFGATVASIIVIF